MLRRWRSGGRHLLAVVTGGVMLLASCTPGGAGSSTEAVVETAPSGEPEGASASGVTAATERPLPRGVELGDLLEAEFGVTVDEMRKAVDRARADVLQACLVAEGWPIEPGMIGPEFFADPQPPVAISAAGASVVAGKVELVETGDGTLDQEGPWSDPVFATEEFVGDEMKCFEEALAAFEDPVMEARRWLDNELAGVYDRVSSDPRMVEADAEERRCLREAGGDPYATLNEIVEAAGTLTREYMEGSRSQEETLAELRDLQRREEELLAAIGPCIEARLAVEREVVAEYEAAWLAENGERLAAFVAELEDEVAALSEYLVGVGSDG